MSKLYTGPNIADILELVESIPINKKLEAEIGAKFSLGNNSNNNRIAERVGLASLLFCIKVNRTIIVIIEFCKFYLVFFHCSMIIS
jgi:hypothetical protein